MKMLHFSNFQTQLKYLFCCRGRLILLRNFEGNISAETTVERSVKMALSKV